MALEQGESPVQEQAQLQGKALEQEQALVQGQSLLQEQMLLETRKRDELLDTVHSAIVLLLASETDEHMDTATSIIKSLELIGQRLNADRVEIWRNQEIDGELHSINTYQWLSEFGKQIKSVPIGSGIPYYETPEWEKMFHYKEYVNSPLSQMSHKDQMLLNAYDIKSIALIPIFLQDQIWGFFSVDNCVDERLFTEDEIDILRSASLMMASVLLRDEMVQDIQTSAAQLDAIVSNYPGVIWSSTAQGSITFVNGLLLKELGIYPIALREGGPQELFPKITEMREKLIAERQTQDWVGEEYGRSLHCRITPVFDSDGKISNVVGSVDDVTELIELQKRLKAQNINALEQFRMIWECVDSGMLIIDTSDRRILDANPAATRMCGGTREDMIGELCYRFFGQHECPIIDMHQVMDREERKFTKLDGTVVPVLKSVVHISYNGRPALLESFTDITYMKEVEEKTHMLEMGERVQLMLEVNPHINILLDSQENVIEFNQAAMSYMGFESNEEMLEGFAERLANSQPVVTTDDRQISSLKDVFQTAVETGSARFDLKLMLKGEEKNLNVELRKIPYEKSFAVVAYLFDMTEIHKRELELTRAHELNELQLVKLTLAAQATKIGLWDMEVTEDDPTSFDNVYIWSDEMRRMLGFSDEREFPNVMQSWLDRLHPDDRNRVMDHYADYLHDTGGDLLYEEEYRLMKKDGEYAYFRSSGKSIRNARGDIVRVAGALMDITETKNILLDTERQRIEAEAANRAKSAFLSTMSHEIRTPMNAILGITEIQLQNDKLDSGLRGALEQIYNSGDMLLMIINDILDLSKIEAGKMELVIAEYEIASLLSDTAQLNMMRIGSKPITFEIEVDEDTPTLLLGDELRIKQVLNNILSNAIKYTASGTVRLTVYAKPTDYENKRELVISISDTGQGMSKEQVSKMFDEYSRFNIEANRATEGTGLGMSITQGLLALMDGQILIESELNVGTVVTIFIPQGISSTEVLGKESAENLHRFRSSSRAQMKRAQVIRELMPYGSVLVVDDTEANIYVAKGLLAPYELKVDSVNSGLAAIELLKKGKEYDIVFMDHMMPGMDGIEATRNIRAMGYKRPIVALTASAGAGQAEMFLENGFDDYISKPIDVRQLNAVLNKLVREKYPLKASGVAGEMASDPQFVEIFLRDTTKSLAILNGLNNKESFSADDLRAYVICTHSLKGVLANIGNMELSGLASKLEAAGRNEDYDMIHGQTPPFLRFLQAFIDGIVSREAQAEDGATAEVTDGAAEVGTQGVTDGDAERATGEDNLYLNNKLVEIKAACERYDSGAADTGIRSLREKKWPASTAELLQKISSCLLHSDFDEATKIIDALISSDSC